MPVPVATRDRYGRGRLTSFLSAVVFLLLAGLPWRAEALAVGNLVVRSSPGEPLRAALPISLQPEESLAQLRVVVASPDAYAVQKLERPKVLDGAQIALLSTGENKGRIQIFGQQSWQGDEVIMLLQLTWPQGQMTKRLRIAPVTTPENAGEKNPLYVEVGTNETLDSIAIRLSKHSNRSYLHMMVALFRANPDAFYHDNINNLKSGVRLRVPSNAELYRLSDAEVNATLREQKERWKRDNEKARQAREAAKKRQQLQQVTRENAEIEKRNQELKQRLERLEKQINSMSKQVLSYEPEKNMPPTAPEPQTAEQKSPAKPPEQKAATEQKKVKAPDSNGLSAVWMILLMLLVSGIVIGIWRFAPRRGKENR